MWCTLSGRRSCQFHGFPPWHRRWPAANRQMSNVWGLVMKNVVASGRRITICQFVGTGFVEGGMGWLGGDLMTPTGPRHPLFKPRSKKAVKIQCYFSSSCHKSSQKGFKMSITFTSCIFYKYFYFLARIFSWTLQQFSRKIALRDFSVM